MATLSPTGGQKTVSASGTAEPLSATSLRVAWLCVRALASNTNDVYFGDSNVDYSTSPQVVLDAGDEIKIDPKEFGRTHIDLNEFYIDVDTNGEGVSFLYLK
jgi:hypothetical protein